MDCPFSSSNMEGGKNLVTLILSLPRLSFVFVQKRSEISGMEETVERKDE